MDMAMECYPSRAAILCGSRRHGDGSSFRRETPKDCMNDHEIAAELAAVVETEASQRKQEFLDRLYAGLVVLAKRGLDYTQAHELYLTLQDKKPVDVAFWMMNSEAYFEFDEFLELLQL